MPTQSIERLTDRIGESQQSVQGFRVEAGKVDEFARAIRDGNPIYRDEAAAAEQGYDAIPAPLTFLRTTNFPRYDPPELPGPSFNFGFDLGFDDRYTLHGQQEYEYHKSLTVGDEVEGFTTLKDVTQKTGGSGGTMTIALLETEYRNDADELFAVDRKTRIEAAGAIGGESGSKHADAEPAGESHGAEASDNREAGEATPLKNPLDNYTPVQQVDELAVDETRTVTETVDLIDFVKYCGAEGSFNPTHWSERHAREAGYRAVFGQGPLLAGFAAHILAGWFGHGRVEQLRTRFTAPYWQGDTVNVACTITAIEAHNDHATVTTTLDARNQTGTQVMVGDAIARIPK